MRGCCDTRPEAVKNARLRDLDQASARERADGVPQNVGWDAELAVRDVPTAVIAVLKPGYWRRASRFCRIVGASLYLLQSRTDRILMPEHPWANTTSKI